MYTAIYKCLDDINNFKIKIKSKEIPSTMIFYNENVQKSDDDFTEIIISWQQKVFTEQQIKKYQDLKNCLTDMDKKYYDLVQKNNIQTHKYIFTYVVDDELSPEKKLVAPQTKLNFFQKFILSLYKSDDLLTENGPSCNQTYTTMRILMKLDSDNGNNKTSNDSETEYELCCLRWDPKNKILIVYPDFSKNKKEPYMLKIGTDLRNIFCYWIENESELLSEKEQCQRNQMSLDLHKRGKKLNKIDIKEIDFDRPGKNEMYVHVFFEICSARKFDVNNLFVQYYIDLPKNWRIHENSNSQQFGVTHCAQVKTLDNYETIIIIGFPFEITLIYDFKKTDLTSALDCPTIYFELISKDTWNRYRSEGYTYKMIPIHRSGIENTTLQCLRVTPTSELRHFFIGGCAILDDITWLDIPTNYKHESVINKFGITTEGSGVLDVKMQIMQHFPSLVDRQDSDKFHEANLFYQSSLVKSINEVLLAFKKARDNMNTARKKLQ